MDCWRVRDPPRGSRRARSGSAPTARACSRGRAAVPPLRRPSATCPTPVWWPFTRTGRAPSGSACSGGGLARLRDGKITRYGLEQGLSSDHVLAIGQGQGGPPLDRHGGWRAQPAREREVQDLHRRAGAWPPHGLLPLRPDAEGALWIGTPGGLTRYKDGKFVNVTHRGRPLRRPGVPDLLGRRTGNSG